MKSIVLFLLAVAVTSPARADPSQFNQEAPIAPYGVPVDPAQTMGDKAATSGTNPVAPLPPLPPQPGSPPPFRDKTAKPH